MYNLPTFYDKDKQLTLSGAFAVLKTLNLVYNSRQFGSTGVPGSPQPEFEPTINVSWGAEVFASEKAFNDNAQPVSYVNGNFTAKNDNLDLLKGQIGKELGAN